MATNGEDIYFLVKGMAADLGFADFGCARACEVPHHIQQFYLQAQEKGHFARMNFLNNNMEKRFNPQVLVEGAKSVLVFLVPYALPEGYPKPEGVAEYALGKDYHIVIKERLFLIMSKIKEVFPQFEGRCFTDSAPVMEREWGVRAALGFIGKNNFLISRQKGIKNFIATIICNAEIPSTDEVEPKKREANTAACGNCARCIENCQSGALYAEYIMDCRLCVSYHTIENRNLAADVAGMTLPNFDGQYFGCDRCLNACPWNSRNTPGWEEFHTNAPLLHNAGSGWWNNLTEEEFKRLLKDSPLLRGGLGNIQSALEWAKKCKDNG